MNNRQAGRRRGRGGQRTQGGNPNQQGNGNRIDNRARGNAAQLLEKYKNLARDAQMQGDRVNAEYFFQFADHYFRVLSETRSRFEENNPNRRPPHETGDDEDEGFEMEGEAADPRDYREPRDERRYEPQRNGRHNGHAHDADGNVESDGEDQQRHVQAEQRHVQADAPRGDDQGQRRGRGRPRRDAAPAEAPAQGIDAAVLPPALGADEAEPAAKPRGRKPRPKSDEASLV